MIPAKTAPIIIIGMHRSGTSLVARMLEDLGVFFGKNKDRNHEAFFFLNFNNWLLLQAGATWDYPEAFQDFANNKKFETLAVDFIRSAVQSPRIINYLGFRRYFRHRSLAHLDFAWGWKDPRNTYTLPLWLEMFPRARVIHVYRQGVDVAHSLKVREDTVFNRLDTFQHYSIKINGPTKLNRLFFLHPKFAFAHNRFAASPRCMSLEGGFALWEDYMKTARCHLKHLDNRAIEIKFEALLAEPYDHLKALAEFCEIGINDSAIERAVKTINADRAYAYRQVPALQDFATQVSDRLKAQGYE